MKNWRDSLIEYFMQGIKEDCGARLGVEVEHFIVDPVRQTAVPYSGGRGVRPGLYKMMTFLDSAFRNSRSHWSRLRRLRSA